MLLLLLLQFIPENGNTNAILEAKITRVISAAERECGAKEKAERVTYCAAVCGLHKLLSPETHSIESVVRQMQGMPRLSWSYRGFRLSRVAAGHTPPPAWSVRVRYIQYCINNLVTFIV